MGPPPAVALLRRVLRARFVERYHPTHRKATEEALRAAAKEGFEVFKAEWESGALANLSLDETAAAGAAPAAELAPPAAAAAAAPAKPATAEGKEEGEAPVAAHTEASGDAANAEPGELQDAAANVLGGHDVASRTHRSHRSANGGKECAHLPGRRCSARADRRARDGARWVADDAPLRRHARGAGQDRALQDAPAHHQARGPGGAVPPARRLPAARDGRAEGVPRLPPHGLRVLRARGGREPRRRRAGGLQGARRRCSLWSGAAYVGSRGGALTAQWAANQFDGFAIHVCVYRTDFERGKRVHFAASQPARKRKDLVHATKLVRSSDQQRPRRPRHRRSLAQQVSWGIPERCRRPSLTRSGA